jgi:chromosome segregation ATPase
MEDTAAPQARERLTRWIEDSREIFALLPEVLDAVQKASAKTEHAEREAERLRRELMGLRKELADAKDKETGGRAQHSELGKQIEDYKKQLEELKQVNEQLKAEKEEAAQAFARLLDTVQSTNQIAQKLGVTKSPFARAHKEPTAPASPTPAPHE